MTEQYSFWIMRLAIDTTGTKTCDLSPQISSEQERDQLIAEAKIVRIRSQSHSHCPVFQEMVIGELPAVQVGSECMLYTFVEVPFGQTFNVSYAPHLNQPIVILPIHDMPFEGIFETPATETLTGSATYDVLMISPY